MSTNQLASLSAPNRELIDVAEQILGLTGETWSQFRRYVTEHLAWCEATGLIAPVGDAERQRYRAHLEQSGQLPSERGWRVRSVYLNKLPAVVAERDRLRNLHAQRRRTRLIDLLPADSPLALGIERILGAVTPGYRRSLRSDMALVLEWCGQEAVDPTCIGPRELSRLRRSLRDKGYRAEGPLVAARRLHREFYVPEVWWR